MKLLGDEAKALRAFELYLDHQSQLAPSMRLHDGIRELLNTIQRHSVPAAIVTGRHACEVRGFFLEQFGS